MQLVTRSTLFALICLSVIASDSASAQVSLPGSNAALRDRAIFGRLGARREARQDRLNRPAPGAQPGAASDAARSAQARSAQARNGQPEKAPELDAGETGRRDAASVRSAQYAAVGGAGSEAGLQPASAATSLPPNRLPYVGSGVSLRLPADLPAEVNYLIDDSQRMVIGSGEEQHLRAKGHYEIRFSRGIDDQGHSYGEARYTITEGAYRFAVTEKGWELFREADQLQTLPVNPPEALQPVVPDPLQPSELSEIQHGESIEIGEPAEPVKPAASAESETLPTPTPTLRSILERE